MHSYLHRLYPLPLGPWDEDTDGDLSAFKPVRTWHTYGGYVQTQSADGPILRMPPAMVHFYYIF